MAVFYMKSDEKNIYHKMALTFLFNQPIIGVHCKMNIEADLRFDGVEGKIRYMGLYIENIIDKKTETLFEAYDITKSHFFDEDRISKLEDTVSMHNIAIQNHSERLNQITG